jgi:hypothetical protein
MNTEHCSKNLEWKWMRDIFFDDSGELLRSYVCITFLPPVETGGYSQATPDGVRNGDCHQSASKLHGKIIR